VPTSDEKQSALPSLLQLETERQLSVNDALACVLGNHTTALLQTVKNAFLPAFLGITDDNTIRPQSMK